MKAANSIQPAASVAVAAAAGTEGEVAGRENGRFLSIICSRQARTALSEGRHHTCERLL